MFATGVGNTDAAFILGTGRIWEKVPESIKFIFDGALPPYLMAKDLILKVLGDITTDGGTYRALEFSGTAVSAMDMMERMTLTNMAIEAGAVNGIIAADETTEDYLQRMKVKSYAMLSSDADARYLDMYTYDVTKIEPLVAKPHSPDNVETVYNNRGRQLTKCYIGSCTGGKLSDFIAAAQILKNQKVSVPTFVVPASTQTANLLESEKLAGISIRDILIQAGCVIADSSCAACLGGPADTIGRAVDKDVVISTTNRNFPGRMGSKQSEVYLASPYTVAASAITGLITDPRDYIY
jgi:3-isopropylmalate/(R)-2-methylmalate dehydratase large subunit